MYHANMPTPLDQLSNTAVYNVWSSKELQLSTIVVFLITLVVNAAVVGRRLSLFPHVLFDPNPISSAWICNFALLLVISGTLAFVLSSGVLIYGAGISESSTCVQTVMLCSSMFLLVKSFSYFWLLERLWMIRQPSQDDKLHLRPRAKSMSYLLGIVLWTVGIPTGIVTLTDNKQHVVVDGTCRMGGRKTDVTMLLSWDVLVSLYLSIVFAATLAKLSWEKSPIHADEKLKSCHWSLIVAMLSFVTASMNATMTFTLLNHLAPICLMICWVDALIKAAVLPLTTSSSTTSLDPTAPSFSSPFAPAHQSSLTTPSTTFGKHKDSFNCSVTDFIPKLRPLSKDSSHRLNPALGVCIETTESIEIETNTSSSFSSSSNEVRGSFQRYSNTFDLDSINVLSNQQKQLERPKRQYSFAHLQQQQHEFRNEFEHSIQPPSSSFPVKMIHATTHHKSTKLNQNKKSVDCIAMNAF